jgi:SAM-dependent methyltransferase
MLPVLYHLHHTRQADDIPFWLNLAARQGGPVLELGCGSGRVYWAVAQAGFQIFGLDLDAGMLACLQSHPVGDGGQKPEGQALVFQGDMAAFHLGGRFALILLPCNTLSTLPQAARAAVFERARRHLLPGGVFAASLPNPELLLAMPSEAEPELEDTFWLPDGGDPVQVSSAWERKEHHFHMWWHYDLLQANGLVQRYTMETVHSLDPAEAYLDGLREAGFKITGLYGDFSGTPYAAEESQLLVIQAEALKF